MKATPLTVSVSEQKKRGSQGQKGGVHPATVIENDGSMETAKKVEKYAKRNALKRVRGLMQKYSNQMGGRKFGGGQGSQEGISIKEFLEGNFASFDASSFQDFHVRIPGGKTTRRELDKDIKLGVSNQVDRESQG
uniref:Uncharacterized protein n=1 Tax=Chromera velia CCMP2878 TaxID=1169474 RepID=A0A0G4HEV7_9ALVE|eukprot:Cvel_6549.t1-p1 / transcript=Cvel_6549.t1 / gene=Cvel_6549 / organism=Chromera_velia_CCMP2878 / gene_product=hypothetical protein / transcript_product=hypothetical protein / location=Cvel_scaffold322:59641-60619(-) / protein_length=134 / sequence_SO=supercontig / SO=protein_coding / is_pseudo=false